MRWNSLTTRLMASFIVFMLAVVLVFSVLPYLFARNALEESIEKRGESVLERLQERIAGFLSRGERESARSYVSGFPATEAALLFVALVGENGVVEAHTDRSSVGKTWEAAGPGTSHDRKSLFERYVPRKGDRMIEMSSPLVIDGKGRGMLVIGLDTQGTKPTLRKLGWCLGLVGLAVMAVAGISTRPFTTRLTSGVNRMVEMTREIAGGELRIQVPEEGFDEIRALAQAFNTMADNLRTAIVQVQETGGGAGEFSSKMLGVIQEQATNAAQQAASVSEVTATVEELSRTSHQIAENAESVKEAAARTVEKAQKGIVLVQGGVEAMTQIKDRVGDIARKTLFLGEKSHEIGKVMDIIKEIASEIHLLALNAAIESAAAGEHGRRFSVVASEVRRLADKTKESTETIRATITEIQSATNASIQATEQGTREVDKWRETIEQSAKAFEEIIAMIEKTSEASMQISLATHQQTSANEQVVQAMHQIAEMVRMTAAHMKESSASAGELKGMVGRMRQSASVFRV